MYLKQQLAAVFDQLKAKDTQLSAMHQQLQAQHAQQTQRAQQAQQAQHAQQAKHGQQLDRNQHTSQEPTLAATQEASKQSAAEYGFSYIPPSHQSPSGRTSPASVPVASLQSYPNPTSFSSSAASTTVQPQLQIVTTTDSMEAADSQTPRHRFVQQRVQELQSSQSSPEKSLSSVSSRLNSPRAGPLGSSSTFRAGLLEGALDSSILEAAGSSPGWAGQSSSASKAAADEAETVAGSSAVGKRSHASDFKFSAASISLQQGSSLHSMLRSSDPSMIRSSDPSMLRPSDPSMMRQQARRVTCASDVSDRATASSAAEERSRSSSPPHRADTPTALQQISPRYQISTQISSSSLQLPSDALAAGLGGSGPDPLPWGGALELGSPGLELPSDEDSDLESASGDKGATGEGPTAQIEGRGATAVEREDSAQFGPEASAMSLPGRHHVPLVQTCSTVHDLWVYAPLCCARLYADVLYYAALCYDVM